jgi:hypothetical protein
LFYPREDYFMVWLKKGDAKCRCFHSTFLESFLFPPFRKSVKHFLRYFAAENFVDVDKPYFVSVCLCFQSFGVKKEINFCSPWFFHISSKEIRSKEIWSKEIWSKEIWSKPWFAKFCCYWKSTTKQILRLYIWNQT